MGLTERLADIEERYERLQGEMASPDVAKDPDRLRRLGKGLSELGEIVGPVREYRGAGGCLEYRLGRGGDEAALWGGTLYEMYQHEAERQRWKTEVLSASPSDLGGVKEVVLEVKGKAAYSRLKHESGVHRVQRVPVTESSGRIHTSTATVAVLPEAEEVDLQIRAEDLKIDVYRSSG